jgi:CheY-like chemotaxis protein
MRKVIIIEDNELVARLYENKLKAAGNTVKVALDGAEGLELIHSFKPDLVLLDLMLPNMSGVDIIRKIRTDQRFAKLPIMAYSSADEKILAEAVEAGSTTLVSKNEASFKEIFEQFSALIEESRNWQVYDPFSLDEADLDAFEEKRPAENGRILIVEDDFITARVVSDIAEKEGLKPHVVSDGQEAYRLLASEANFAAAVLDIELPKIKGTDLLKYMRSEKRLRYVPVIVMTASSEYIRLQLESHHTGATFFISKPFERGAFELLLKNLPKI